MWPGDEEDQEEGSDYDENETNNTYFIPSFVVIAIDCHPLMFIKGENGTMPFRSCLEACHAIADSLVLTVDKKRWNPFAIVLAKEHEPDFINFKDNILDSVKLLKNEMMLSNQELIDKYRRTKDFDLADFFLHCKKVFHNITSFYRRDFVYITNNDMPVNSNNNKFTVLNEVKTFPGSQITFQIVSTIKNFNYKLFYNELFSLLDGPHIEEICEDTAGLIDKLKAAVIRKYNRKRVNFYPFKNDTTRFIKCYKLDLVHTPNIYNTNMTKDGKRVKLGTDIGDETPTYCFRCSEIERADSIQFDRSEKDSMLDFSMPKGLVLLFVSKRISDVGAIVAKTNLLQADLKDESPYFKRFWQFCVDSDRVLVCALKMIQPCKLRYAELIPVLVDGFPMFMSKIIPHSNEIVYPLNCTHPEKETNDERKNAIRNLVDKLTIDFDMKMIPDPVFRKRKAYIRAKLLDEPMEEVTDIAYDKSALDNHLKDVVMEMNSVFDLSVEKKRKKSYRGSGSKRNRN